MEQIPWTNNSTDRGFVQKTNHTAAGATVPAESDNTLPETKTTLTTYQPDDHDLLIELKTSFQYLQQDLRAMVQQILQRLDGYVPNRCIEHTNKIEQLEGAVNPARCVAHVAKIDQLEQQVSDIRSANTWLTRLIAGSFITAVISGLTAYLLARGGNPN